MAHDYEKDHLDFHNRASALVEQQYNLFRTAAAFINGLHDENVFQQLKGKHILQLQHQLVSLAQELLQQMPPQTNRDEQNKIISGFITGYIQEFRRMLLAQ